MKVPDVAAGRFEKAVMCKSTHGLVNSRPSDETRLRIKSIAPSGTALGLLTDTHDMMMYTM